MGYSRFWLKAADEESKSLPHEFPRSHWLKATGQSVLERYLSATMPSRVVMLMVGYESHSRAELPSQIFVSLLCSTVLYVELFYMVTKQSNVTNVKCGFTINAPSSQNLNLIL